METVLIVIHLMIVIALVGVVLLQRSEGGALGIGGGNSGLMTTRSAASALTRVTAILAAGFFITSLSLGIWARYNNPSDGIIEQIPTNIESDGQGIFNQLDGTDTTVIPQETEPSVPTGN